MTDSKHNLRIAVIGHACSPRLGSEPGFTWKWATNLARHCQVTCFCHPEHRDDIETELAAHPVESLRFVFVNLDPARDPWKPEQGEKGIRIHYGRWQHKVVEAILSEHAKTPFDLLHHVSWGSLNQPPKLWKTGIPWVWGPVGGGQTWPARFLDYADSKWRERLRLWVINSARFNPAVARAAKSASIVFATNNETAAVLKKAGAKRVEMLLDSGFTDTSPALRTRDSDKPLTLLWAGRLEARKGLTLALEAIALLPQPSPLPNPPPEYRERGQDDSFSKTNPLARVPTGEGGGEGLAVGIPGNLALLQHCERGIKLLVAGDGPHRAAIEAEIDRLRLRDRVELLGQVPFAQMQDLFSQSDAFLFTSLRDSMGSVVLEAMSAGLPVICLDHQGVAVAVNNDNGFKIPVMTPTQVIQDLAKTLEELIQNPALLDPKRKALLSATAANTWPARAQRMIQLYNEVLHAHRPL